MKFHLALLTIVVLAVAANAADINGKWVAQVTGGMGPMGGQSERIFTFQVTGEKVTGTIEDWQVAAAKFEEKGKPAMSGTLKTRRAEPQQINEGKVNGDSVTFAVVSQGFMGEQKTNYKGKILGTEIKFTVEQEGGMGGMGGGMGGPMGGGGPQEIVAKKMP
jgi:hypothetical protein